VSADGYYTQMVLDTIADLAPRPGGWVSLRRLREALAAVPREVMDTVLLEIDLRPEVQLIAEINQKSLTDASRAAALRVGNQDRHLIAVDPSAGGAR
jgi:hypothetical protein